MVNSTRMLFGRFLVMTSGASIGPIFILPVTFMVCTALILSMPPRALMFFSMSSSAVWAETDTASRAAAHRESASRLFMGKSPPSKLDALRILSYVRQRDRVSSSLIGGNMNGKSILLSLVILTGCSTPSTVATLNVSLQYKSMASPGEFSTFPPCARLSGARIEDAREDRTLGKRFAEGKRSPHAPETTTSDVAAWAKQGLDSVLKKSSVGTDAAAAPSLVVTIEQINTNENVLHRAGYDGDRKRTRLNSSH